MILYHGSYLIIEKPDIAFSRNNVDFGRGFYTTPIKEQAVSWSARFKKRHGQSIVSAYEICEEALLKDASVLRFDNYSDEWLEFIIACRQGNVVGDYDLVIGGVANDKVFDTIQLFLDGLIDKEQSIKRLRYEKTNVQYCFRSQVIIEKHLKFLSSEVT
ncbi:MAG: DUF3990 domain-containing protein [Defluviitaleaceae bacterium]|nr:DUF3990 domain-containing protein [Defluviitaleaceae bacterium]